MLDYKLTTLVCQQKNFENRLIFGEIMGKSLVSCSFWLTMYISNCLAADSANYVA